MHLKPKAPASMLTKLLRKDRDNGKEIRGGNRGGKDQFKWEEVRSMSYKDRECYLGYTAKIGFLDKGGKWRKGDWFKKLKRNKKIEKSRGKSKIDEVKEKD